jgi:5-methylthioribose kinase
MGVMIIDPEFAFPAPPEFDVGVLIAHLTMAGFEQPEIMMLLRSYVTPPRFSYPLALASAGMEIIRRLLGVAQLPRTADDESTSRWLQTARSMVMT